MVFNAGFVAFLWPRGPLLVITILSGPVTTRMEPRCTLHGLRDTKTRSKAFGRPRRDIYNVTNIPENIRDMRERNSHVVRCNAARLGIIPGFLPLPSLPPPNPLVPQRDEVLRLDSIGLKVRSERRLGIFRLLENSTAPVVKPDRGGVTIRGP